MQWACILYFRNEAVIFLRRQINGKYRKCLLKRAVERGHISHMGHIGHTPHIPTMTHLTYLTHLTHLTHLTLD